MTTSARRHLVAATALALSAAGCGDSTGVSGPQNVSLNFRVGTETSAAGAPAASAGPALVAGAPMTLHGTNGMLVLDEVLIIVNEAELKHADGSCDVIESSDDSCPEFEAPPRFLDLPLDGSPIEAITALVPPGTYKELDFEVEDLEDDEENPVVAAAIEQVRAEVLATVPDWPRKASAMVRGTFTPTGGDAEDFRVFIDAEIEIELELVPNLVISDDGGASRDLTVAVHPEIWFLSHDGAALVLPEWDYDSTNRLLSLEVEMEEGFTEVELETEG